MYECVYSGQEGGHFRRLENNFIIGLAFRIGMPFDMGPEGLPGCRRAPPNGAAQHGRRSHRCGISAHKASSGENRRTAMNLSWPLLAAALQWGLRRSANERRTKEGA